MPLLPDRRLPGIIGPDGQVWLPDRFAPDGPVQPATLLSIGVDATGTPHQNHLVYAAADQAWWLFYPDQVAPATLRCARSVDLATWVDKQTVTLAHSLKGGTAARYGYNLAVAYDSISGVDVVHVTTGWSVGGNVGLDHVRATIAGGEAIFGPQAAIVSVAQTVNQTVGPGNSVDSNGRPQLGSPVGTADAGDLWERRASNADAGSSWTAGWDTPFSNFVGAAFISVASMLDLGGGVSLHLSDSSSATPESAQNVKWIKSAGTGVWSGSVADALAADTTAVFSAYDWGAAVRTGTDVHLVVRNPDTANAWIHRRFNGTAWSAGAAVPSQASKAGGGVFVASDGVDVWLFVIDSDAANTVRYVKWSSGAATWGAWTAFESSTQVRTALSGCRAAGLVGGASTLGVCWTEAAGLPFRVVAKPLPLAVPAAWVPAVLSPYSGVF